MWLMPDAAGCNTAKLDGRLVVWRHAAARSGLRSPPHPAIGTRRIVFAWLVRRPFRLGN